MQHSFSGEGAKSSFGKVFLLFPLFLQLQCISRLSHAPVDHSHYSLQPSPSVLILASAPPSTLLSNQLHHSKHLLFYYLPI